MAQAEKVSNAALIAGLLLAALTLFLTLVVAGSAGDTGGGDAAGRAIAEGFVTLALLVLYVFGGAFALVALLNGDMPALGRGFYALLTACASIAMWLAFSLLLESNKAPGQWPAAIVGGAPVLVVAYGLWGLIAPLRRALDPRVAGGIFLGGLALLIVSIIPMTMARERAVDREAARIAEWQAKFGAMPANAPLPQWLPFLDSGVYDVGEGARQKLVTLPTRQTDAEGMLDADTFPFADLSEFDFDPTPQLCQKALASLSRRAAAVPPPAAKSSFGDISDQVGGASRGITWLVGFACASDAQSAAWEAVARRYGATDYDVADLVAARDPKQLGSVLYNSPPHASMLTPKASLRAWLSFAWAPGGIAPDVATYIDGARELDHRNADAVAWLSDPNASSDNWELLRFLPDLDLQPTPQLCAAALGLIGPELTDAYHPTADNPLAYPELDQRLGQGQPLQALLWLAGQGCPSGPQIDAAETLVKAYQAAPEREAMLAALAAVKK